jgi:hypothetical protein
MRQVRFEVAQLLWGWLVVLCGSTYRLIVGEHGIVMMHGFPEIIMLRGSRILRHDTGVQVIIVMNVRLLHILLALPE